MAAPHGTHTPHATHATKWASTTKELHTAVNLFLPVLSAQLDFHHLPLHGKDNVKQGASKHKEAMGQASADSSAALLCIAGAVRSVAQLEAGSAVSRKSGLA